MYIGIFGIVQKSTKRVSPFRDMVKMTVFDFRKQHRCDWAKEGQHVYKTSQKTRI